jgi:hypothetical protein
LDIEEMPEVKRRTEVYNEDNDKYKLFGDKLLGTFEGGEEDPEVMMEGTVRIPSE